MLSASDGGCGQTLNHSSSDDGVEIHVFRFTVHEPERRVETRQDVVQLFRRCLVVRSISCSDDSRRRRRVDVTTSRLDAVELFGRRDQHQHPADRGTATPHTRRRSVVHPLYGQVATNDGAFTPRAHPRESAPLTARHRSRCKRLLTMRTADTLANLMFTEQAARTDPGRKR